MFASPIVSSNNEATFLDAHLSTNSVAQSANSAAPTKVPTPTAPIMRAPIMRANSYRESNVEIGRAAEKAGITVRDYDRKDRWVAWRKRAEKVKVSMLARAAKANRKAKGKKSNKKVAPRAR